MPPARQDPAPDPLLFALQSLSESELTETVLLPLFARSGFDHCEKHHGNSEHGVDLLLWKSDPLVGTELSVVQVKRVRHTARAKDPHGLYEVARQLIVAQGTSFPNARIGGAIRPSRLLFVTPFPVSSRQLAGAFPAALLESARFHMIDGRQLARLVETNLPERARTLRGLTHSVAWLTQRLLTNEDLMRALGHTAQRTAAEFFLDVSFRACRNADFWLASLRPRASHVPLPVGPNELEEITAMAGALVCELGFTMLDDANRAALEAFRARTAALRQARETRLRERMDAERRLPKTRRVDTLSDQERQQRQMLLMEEDAREFRNDLRLSLSLDLDGLFRALHNRHAAVTRSLSQMHTLLHDGPSFCKAFQSASTFFRLAERIVHSRLLQAHLSVDSDDKADTQSTSVCLNVGVMSLLETGMSLAIFGDAGSGKTTALQTYAARRLQSGTQDLVLFVPLARAVRMWQNLPDLSTHTQSYHAPDMPTLSVTHDATPNVPRVHAGPASMVDLLVAHLTGLELGLSKESLRQELATRRCVMLFDGVDEAIASAPGILELIHGYVKEHPQHQVVVSSRSSGRDALEVDLPSVTLEPFTLKQRDDFIRQWFSAAGRETHVRRLAEHLSANPRMGDVLRNPLLVTVMCVLEENSLPLPDHEVRLYEERLRLLLGAYDVHKGIRRFRSPQYQMEQLARGLAHMFHVRKIRGATMDELLEMSRVIFRNVSDEAILAKILELRDLCNILVPEPDGIRFGFGHLRFQEHLAACELMRNRGLSLLPLIQDRWWHGVFGLFAAMNDNLLWFANWLTENGHRSSLRTNFEMIANAAKPAERFALERIAETS